MRCRSSGLRDVRWLAATVYLVGQNWCCAALCCELASVLQNAAIQEPPALFTDTQQGL